MTQAVGACTFVRVGNTWEQLAVRGAERFGSRIRSLRQSQGWTQGDLAKRMTSAGYPMHQTTVAKIENATRPTSVEEMFALSAIFGLSVDDFFRATPQQKLQSAQEHLYREIAELEARCSAIASGMADIQDRLARLRRLATALTLSEYGEIEVVESNGEH